MQETDLKKIEAELQLQLPLWYRAACLQRPFRTPGVKWMFDDPDAVIGNSRYPLQDGDYEKLNWNPGYVAIGESAAGDLYLIDAAAATTTVHCLSHEDHSIMPGWPSFQEFVDDWLAYEAEADERRRQQQEFDRWFWRRWRLVMLVIFIFAFVLPLLLIGVAQMMKQ